MDNQAQALVKSHELDFFKGEGEIWEFVGSLLRLRHNL